MLYEGPTKPEQFGEPEVDPEKRKNVYHLDEERQCARLVVLTVTPAGHRHSVVNYVCCLYGGGSFEEVRAEDVRSVDAAGVLSLDARCYAEYILREQARYC